MPGLVGCTSRDRLNPDLITAMIQPMCHRSDYQVWEHVERNFTVGTIDLAQGRQNAKTESQNGRYVLVFFGSLYESWASSGENLAARLLERWVQGSWKSLADLNGDYLILIWDRLEERLTIINDRLGPKRLNYWQSNGTFAWASEVKSLAVISEVSRTIDECALSELLTFGHLQEDRTLLRDVKLLPPGSVLTWQQGKLKIDQYWRYAYKADPRLKDSDRAIDEFANHLANSVSRRIQGVRRIGLFLSGGLDSRTLSGVIRMVRPEGELLTWTSGHGHDHDTRFAKKIAKAVRSKHTFIRIPETFLEDLGPNYAWILDGMVTSHGAHRLCLMSDASLKADAIMIGYLGDTVAGDKKLDRSYHISKIDELIRFGFSYFPQGFTDELMKQTMKPEVYNRVHGFAFERFAAGVKEAKVEFSADRLAIAELIQRQHLWNPISQMDLMGVDVSVSTPFADKEFINFALRLPVEQRHHKKAYLGMICRYLPQLARIPRSGEGLPLIHSRLRASLHWRWVLFERNTLPKLTGGKVGGHNYGPFVHCAEWFRNFSREFIEKTLINNPILEEHFQMERLNEMVLSFLDNTADRDLMNAVAALMTYVLFRQQLAVLPQCQLKKDSLVHAIQSFEKVIS